MGTTAARTRHDASSVATLLARRRCAVLRRAPRLAAALGALSGLAASLGGVVGCGGGASPPPLPSGFDGGADLASVAARTTCSADVDCNDGLFCNRQEQCAPASAMADARGCVPGDPPCAAAERCDESANDCHTTCEDRDGDGHEALACGGDDCDDTDATRYPGATEVCDLDDEDCDDATLGFVDADVDAVGSSACCNGAACGGDCDDGNASIRPGIADGPSMNCNGIDDDWDGRVDDNFPCSPGQVLPCTTACGTPGLRVCTATCAVPPSCNAVAETCNSCDDDGTIGTLDEVALASATLTDNADECSDFRNSGIYEICRTTMVSPAETGREIGMAIAANDGRWRNWFATARRVGYGPVTWRVTMSVAATSASGAPRTGWALAVSRGGTGDIGPDYDKVGVPYGTRLGFFVPWFFGGSVLGADVDDVDVRRMRAGPLDPRGHAAWWSGGRRASAGCLDDGRQGAGVGRAHPRPPGHRRQRGADPRLRRTGPRHGHLRP
jgi:hypothetical protein